MFKIFRNKNVEKLSSTKKYKNVKIGLALGGGASRGFAHIGVIKAFEEYGVKFDFVSGTSVGSLVGALYCSGRTSTDMIEIAKNINEKDIRNSKIIFVPSKTAGIENIIINNLGDINVEDLQIPFSAVAVDIKTTEEIAIRSGNLAKAVAGSCAVPGVFTPVEFENMLLSDGGLQNAIPSDIPKLYGCDYVVAVDVNCTRTYGTESTKLLDVLLASVRILMKSTPIKGYLYSDVILQPNLKKFKSTKMEGMDEMIAEGYRVAKEHMPEILALFSKKPVKRKKKYTQCFASSENKKIENGIDKSLINVNENEEN